MGYLFWIDLEMTGLNCDTDSILEIASIVTTDELEIVAHGPDYAIHQPQSALATMDEWNIQHHTNSGLIERSISSKVSLQQAEEETMSFFAAWCKEKTVPLCGNTIYQDRAFLRRLMPKINDYAHYRMIDVSTIKELVHRWYPNNSAAHFEKKKVHRAHDDILESIAELQWYRKNFFVSNV